MLMAVAAVGAVLELSSEKLLDSTLLQVRSWYVEGHVLLLVGQTLFTPVAGYCYYMAVWYPSIGW